MKVNNELLIDRQAPSDGRHARDDAWAPHVFVIADANRDPRVRDRSESQLSGDGDINEVICRARVIVHQQVLASYTSSTIMQKE